jgi:TRAP-type C4-dicarboxylate transport system permease small subunit
MSALLLGLNRVERAVAALSFGVMTLLVLVDIGMRELLKQSFPIGPKLALDFMIWGGFLGASITSAKGTHLKAEAFEKLWPKSLKPAVETLSELLTTAFCGGMAYLSIRYVAASHEMGEVGVVTGVPLWVSQAVIPLTFSLMTLRHLAYTLMPSIKPRPSVEDLK